MMKMLFAAAILVASAASQAGWDYDHIPDPMTSKETLLARTRSTNTITLGSPYAGPQQATLMLRKHPRHGTDVMLMVERGQFNCHSGGCSILVRFDDLPAQHFRATPPSDSSSDSIFIGNFSNFYGHAVKAKHVLIEAEFFSNGNRQMQFDVGGLDPKFLAVKAAASAPRKCTAQEKTRLWLEHREFPDRVQPSCA